MKWFCAKMCLILVSGHVAVCGAAQLRLEHDKSAGKIIVLRDGTNQPILTQNAKPDFRPYIHPIVAPNGKGILTEYSPGHHKHQTGLYWGFTRVNGRDFFHHPGASYWRRVATSILQNQEGDGGKHVRWQTLYDMLSDDGTVLMTETQIWTMHERDGRYVLDLQWKGEAKTDITIGKYDYGGLFVRMPWRKGIRGRVVNAARQSNQRAEGQRAPWLDVAIQVEGREDLAHVAIFDHPDNDGFPLPWRVDGQLGVGPARARLGDWKILAGKTTVVRHQLQIYSGELNDVELTKEWSSYSGQGGTWALWRIAQVEGRKAEFLSPQQAVAAMTLPDGFQVNVFASEPMIAQPMAFCWDDRGRMWIAENRDYETRGTGFSNYGDSRILILEDTDRDGVADTREVFLEGVPFPSAIAVGFGGLWLGAPPNLLFIPDRDHDDRADLNDIEVRLAGWGIRDRHETLNSFHWGPDGWLYGCQGFATPSRVGKPAGKGRIFRHNDPFPQDIELDGESSFIDGGVWRYHPTKDRFEVVAHGFSNPWGIDYDAKGQLFISACVIPHLWHVIPGGIYHRQGGKHLNPYYYSDITTIADHRHRSAHGGARVYLSDAFPQEYHGRIFMANIHEHSVLTDVLEPKGSGFVGRHGDDFLAANNAQWIGFSMEIGPGGDVFVLDWHDADICGKEVLNKDTGRVFRITPTRSQAINWKDRFSDLSKLPNQRLVELQRSASTWHARRARVLLQYRAARGEVEHHTLDALRIIYHTDANPDWRLRAMWALHVIESLREPELVSALEDCDQHIRAWAIQLVSEDFNVSPNVIEVFVRLAESDPSPVVRLYLASALQRLKHSDRWAIARGLLTHGEDSEDHNIPKMIWFGIEPAIPENPGQALELATTSRMPAITRQIARRLADADDLSTLVDAIDKVPSIRKQLLLGMRDGLEGRFDVVTPANWTSLYVKLENEVGDVGRVATELAQQFGDMAAGQKMLAVLVDAQSDTQVRRQALTGLSLQRFPKLKPHLVPLLKDEALRRDAIRAMASFDDREIAKSLLRHYHSFNQEDKFESIHTLASRSKYGWELTQAIKRGEIPRRDIPAYIARLLQRVVGNGFLEVWGPIEALSSDQQLALLKYQKLLTDEYLQTASASRGRVVFQRTCMACHKLYGEGGIVGPDITGANRNNLEYLLGNILTPSAIIQDAYKMSIVVTDEGRVVSGILAGENERQIQLRVANQQELMVIAKSEIESREVASVSMMPSGLLNTLTDTEVVDLIAYLRTPKQVPMKE